MKNKMNQQESLQLINEMIAQARNNYHRGLAQETLFAGYSVAAVAILNFVLLSTLSAPTQSFWVWLLMIPMAIATNIIGRKNSKENVTKSHIDTIITQIWNCFGMTIIILLTTIFCLAFIRHEYYVLNLITPLILLLTGIAQYSTGVACKFSPYKMGAFVFQVGALACLATYLLHAEQFQFIILAASFVFGFIIPGHMLNKKIDGNV